eukprot:1159652-Pelagomonas_calceolata.AAC.3
MAPSRVHKVTLWSRQPAIMRPCGDTMSKARMACSAARQCPCCAGTIGRSVHCVCAEKIVGMHACAEGKPGSWHCSMLHYYGMLACFAFGACTREWRHTR